MEILSQANKSKIKCHIFSPASQLLMKALTVNTVSIVNYGLNSIYQLKLTGTITTTAKEISQWHNGYQVKLWLQHYDSDTCLNGDITQCSITKICSNSQVIDLELIANASLIRLKQKPKKDYFSNTPLSEIFKTLLEQAGIYNYQFKFSDIVHPFELQYQQTDFDLFTSLTVQYGLIYYYQPVAPYKLIIEDKAPQQNLLHLKEQPNSGLVNKLNHVYDLSLYSHKLPQTIRLRAEANDHSQQQYIAIAGNKEDELSCIIDLYELYACYSAQECQQFANILKGQLDWQRLYLKFKAPLFQFRPGDNITFEETADPRIIGTYQVISINTEYTQQQPATEPQSYQQIIAVPVTTPFYPVHPLLSYQSLIHIEKQMQTQQIFFQPYQIANPPFLQAKIKGSHLQACPDQQGLYQVHLNINKEKFTPPLRLLQNYSGKNHRGAYGLEFPLYGNTDVVISIINDCPQRLVILGAFYGNHNLDVCNSSNAKQHIMQSHNGLGLCLDESKKSLCLYNKSQHQYLALHATPKQQTIKLISKIGTIKLSSPQLFKQTSQSNFRIVANSIYQEVGQDLKRQAKNINYAVHNNYQIKSKKSYLLAKKVNFSCNNLNIQSKNNMRMTSKKIHIQTDTLILSSKKMSSIKASHELNLYIANNQTQFTNQGYLYSDKKVTVNVKQIEKHLRVAHISI